MIKDIMGLHSTFLRCQKVIARTTAAPGTAARATAAPGTAAAAAAAMTARTTAAAGTSRERWRMRSSLQT